MIAMRLAPAVLLALGLALDSVLAFSTGPAFLGPIKAAKGISLRSRAAARMPAARRVLGSGLKMSSLKDDIMADFDDLFEANKQWIKYKTEADKEFFQKLDSVDIAKIMWIGCADSRVPSDELIGADGQTFVHRNIANVVMNTDNSMMSGLTYAVNVLEVEHIVVCGHSKCGGVKASLTARNFSPPLEGWLSHLQMVYRHHRKELDAIEDEEDRVARLVDLNVIEQCKNVYRAAVVQQKLAAGLNGPPVPFHTPRIHGCVYDVATGFLKRVNWVTEGMDDPYGMWSDQDQSKRYDVQNLIESNQKWVMTKQKNDPNYFKNIGEVEKPSIFWVGCADSRVPSNEIIGAEPGEIFTHRNIANVVMQTDQNLQSGLQYAVDALEVDHIVVCGHTSCGGVAASLTPTAFSPPLEGWLHHLANVYRLHTEELDAIPDQKARLRRLVELNVLEQCNNIAASALVQTRQKQSLEAGAPYPVPRIHGFVYDLEKGELIDLKWNAVIRDSYGDYNSTPELSSVQEKPQSRLRALFNRKPAGFA